MPFSIISANQDSIFTEGSLITVRDVEGKPLIIVDGEELTGVDISTIDPETIESVSVLKDHAAEELYKEKGKNGVIQIVTKKK